MKKEIKIKESFKTQKAFYKEYNKRVETASTGYCMEDFAFDLFKENKKIKKLLEFLGGFFSHF